MEISLFIPCFIDQVFPETGINTVKVLEKAGCKVDYNPAQTCCGQPALNAGFRDESKAIAGKFLNDFKGDRIVVTPSGSCAGMICTNYPDLFKNSVNHNLANNLVARTFELSEFLVDQLGVTDFGATFNHKVAYHDACGALRECGIKSSPRKLLEKIKGLELVEMPYSETCCGFGGTFAVKFEPISVSMAQQKVDNALSVGAEYIVSTDSSCLMHIQAYIDKHNLPITTISIADILVQGWS
ncbi:MAG: L-lactate dehydrogenase complex protein LldE [Sphingobacteriales bacterium]|jgi:L-lactate dehydrogenase complex protein LldE